MIMLLLVNLIVLHLLKYNMMLYSNLKLINLVKVSHLMNIMILIKNLIFMYYLFILGNVSREKYIMYKIINVNCVRRIHIHLIIIRFSVYSVHYMLYVLRDIYWIWIQITGDLVHYQIKYIHVIRILWVV